MQNALLVGLSRQVALGRELDVVANNIANINTTGFKADGAVFEEFISPTARRTTVCAPTARVSFVQRPRDLGRPEPGPTRAHRQSARRRDRRQRLPRRADAERRTLHAQRRAPDQCRRRTGDQRRLSGARRIRADHLAAEGPRHHDQRRRHDQRARRQQRQTESQRGKLRLVSFDNPACCRRTAPALSRRRPASRRRPTRPSRFMQGTIEKSNVRSRD